MKSKGTIGDYRLILKSGTTDLRRKEKTLTAFVEQNYPGGIQPDVLYAFSNKIKSTIKILKIKPDASSVMIKLKHKERYPWPEYREKGENGYIVTFTAEKKNDFLASIGLPDGL